ncbi:MAG: hypothetical protein H6673_08340 [Anaerolineales bacterium]|nr:hypothetical protein [Anaerolineales bacterium]
MPRYLRLSFLFLFIMLAAFTAQSELTPNPQPAPVLAQAGGTCDTLVNEALELVANNCVSLGRNEVCYGHATVSATLNDDSYFFDVSGDIIPVTALEAMITRPADPETGDWGIVLMDIQADLPDANDGMRIVLFGGVELEPVVTATADVPTCTFTNTSNGNFNMRTGPGQSFPIVDVLDRDASVEVYGITSNGRWVRSARGWVFAEEGTLECGGDDLLVMDNAEDAYVAPMQSFTLRMDEDALCQAAPSGLLIQTPTGETANLMVNNVQMRVGSTAFLTVNQAQTCQTVANIDGHVNVTDEVLLPKGAQLTLPLTDDASDCPGAGKVEPISGPILELAASLPTQLPEPVDIPEPWVPVPPTVDFSAANESITFGECTTLSWEITDAMEAYLDGELAPFINTLEVCPEETTTYELQAVALTDDPAVTSEVTVEVLLPEGLAMDFYAEPTTLHPGECSTLYWDTAGATQVFFDMGLGNEAVSATGNRTLCFDLAGTYAYALEALAPSGDSVRRTAIVEVNPFPEVTFTATPTLIALSDCATLNWTTLYAAEVYLEGDPVAENGSRSVCPGRTGITTYTLDVVSESDQPFSYTVDVDVVIGEVLLTLNANPTTLLTGECTTVTWTSQYAQLVYLNTGGGEVPVALNGSTSVCHSNPGTKTYTLRGISFVGQSFTTSTTAEVMAFNSFTATPNEVLVGGEIVLAWDVANATLVELNTGAGFIAVASSGNQSVFPATAGLKTYSLRATSPLGGTRTTTVTANVYNNPVVNSFSASPNAVATGSCTTVSWNVSDAEFVYINFGSGEVPVATSGSQQDCPGAAGTKTYDLRAVSFLGVDFFGSTDIEVLAITFSTSPSQVYVGNGTTISWNVTGNVSAVALNVGSGFNPVANPGSAPRVEASAGTYTYTLQATASNGTNVIKTTTLQVFSTPTINSFSASPIAVLAGNCTTVSWNVTNASAVFINFGAGEVPVAASGSQQDCPGAAGTKNYALRAVGALGDNYFANTSVEVLTITFSTSPSQVYVGNGTTVSWSVGGNVSATFLNLGGGEAPVGNPGSTPHSEPSAGSYTYTLRAVASNGGSVSKTTTLQVYNIPSLSISTNPTTIELGTCTTVSWNVSSATAVFINFGAGEVPVAASGSQADCPVAAGNKNYALRAVGALGDNYFANASVDVVGINFGVDLDQIDEIINIVITWNVSNAMSVELDTGSGYSPVGFNGTTTVTITSPGTYTFRLRVTANGGAVFVHQDQVVIQ